MKIQLVSFEFRKISSEQIHYKRKLLRSASQSKGEKVHNKSPVMLFNQMTNCKTENVTRYDKLRTSNRLFSSLQCRNTSVKANLLRLGWHCRINIGRQHFKTSRPNIRYTCTIRILILIKYSVHFCLSRQRPAGLTLRSILCCGLPAKIDGFL